VNVRRHSHRPLVVQCFEGVEMHHSPNLGKFGARLSISAAAPSLRRSGRAPRTAVIDVSSASDSARQILVDKRLVSAVSGRRVLGQVTTYPRRGEQVVGSTTAAPSRCDALRPRRSCRRHKRSSAACADQRERSTSCVLGDEAALGEDRRERAVGRRDAQVLIPSTQSHARRDAVHRADDGLRDRRNT